MARALRKVGKATVHGALSMLMGGLATVAAAGPLPRSDVPGALKDWLPWTLHGQEALLCPPAYNAESDKACVWPSALSLQADAGGARFRYEVQLFGPQALVALPGEPGRWPADVRADGQPLPVTEQDGRPTALLQPGRHVIEGRFDWKELPPDVRLPLGVGSLSLSVNGAAVQRVPDNEGRVWLRQAPEAEQSTDAYSVHTTRRIDDGVPLRVTTHIDIAVSGKARELVLPVALLPGLVPEALESALPARLQEGGALVVQARPGRWRVSLRARLMSPVQALSLPKQAPEAEVWSFEAHNDVRLVSVEGAASVDPRQVAMPDDWRNLPAYRLLPGGTLKLVQSRRGNPEPPPDRLTLTRDLWLDFDGAGYTAHDVIGGTLSRSSRLEMAAPAVLGRASVDGEDQPVTRLKEGGPQGFEVRGGTARLSADSRIEGAVRTLPATGWQADLNQATASLNLPPGWRLLHAVGVDSAEGSWLSRWTLWDFFFVLLSALAAGKLFGVATGGLLGVALVLSWHMPGAPQSLWLALLGLHALARVLPAGRLVPWVRWGERAVAVLIALVLLPYAVDQVRLSIYPSLERPWQTMGDADPTRTRETAEAAMADQAMAEAPSPAPAEVGSEYGVSSASRKVAQASTTKPAAPAPTRREDVDPSARVQTGPGLPRWQWNTHRLVWQGPVQAAQALRLVLLPPAGTVALRLLSLGLMAWALWRIVGGRGPDGGLGVAQAGAWPWQRRDADGKAASSTLTTPAATPSSASVAAQLAGAAVLVSTLTLGLASGAADAASAPTPKAAATAPAPAEMAPETTEPATPSASVLDELRDRVTAAPDCMPRCADIARALVVAQGARIQLRLEVHALADVAVPLPGQGSNWRPSQITVDGRSAAARRDGNGALWVALPRGVNQVVLDGDAGQAASVDIALPLPVREVRAQAEGWTLSGLDARGQASGALSLSRAQAASAASDGGTQRDALPPFVRVQRTVHLGLRWTIETRIQRVAPSLAPVRVRVRLAPGESVNDEAVQVQDGVATVLLGAGEAASFTSTLAVSPRLTLDSTREPHQIEVWTLDASTQWHTRLSGIAPVVHQAEGRWMPTWQPWPGEQVVIDVTRPAGVAGQTFTVDQAHTNVTPGARATDVSAQVSLRSSQGGNHRVELPEGAELLGVWVDGQQLPLQAAHGVLMVPVTPGAHELRVDWREQHGMGPRFASSSLNLGAPGVNDTVSINVPRDRVVLAVGGPAVGPAVLFWGVLLVIVAAGIALGRWRFSPLGAVSWVLLGLGVAQMSLAGVALVVGWFLVLEARGRWAGRLKPRSFKAVQVLLALWGVVAAGTLLETVRVGLLGYPDLMILGNGSDASHLHWYADRFAQSTASAWVVSMPVLLYRVVMLLWALWLAASMLRWIRWGWERFSAGGYWPEKAPVVVTPIPPSADTPAATPATATDVPAPASLGAQAGQPTQPASPPKDPPDDFPDADEAGKP
ncbi:MAG TPA: hypothetical protein H9903_05910 [Candidatus Aquabacterium excrementipullorum]|nr:hypothetical protein [Candidatus Aquabacterium excrementipullorum]